MASADAAATSGHPEGDWLPLFGVWLLSLTATFGSLFFSEIMRLPPCVLCWYQRICMYPLVAISTVGLLQRDANAARYAWPLVVAGTGVAIYHNLLYYHVIPDSITPCAEGVSCTTRQIEWLGFITIPLLSLAAFTLIAACLLAFHRNVRPPGTPARHR
jgi:disulfide bond formation protein DsbB